MTSDHATMQLELTYLKSELDEVKEEIKAMRSDQKELLDAWRTATGLVKFVKLLAGIATALAVLIGTYKGTSK